MRGRAVPQTTCDVQAVSVEHLHTGMRPAVAETSEEIGEPHSRKQVQDREYEQVLEA